ncbi:MAG TPA: hypothetical protein VFN24_02955 [Microbacterium sp.]|nr:hypothetical protein [Microbacterium sp.]
MKPPRTSASIILRATLIWCAVITGFLAVIGAVLGYAVGGMDGLWSALVGVVLAAVFLGLTAGLILFAQRFQGPEKLHLFFGLIIGGLLVKLLVFVAVLLLLRGQPWIDGRVFVFAVVASVLASLIIDLVVMAKARAPYVDVTLPESVDDPQNGSAGT